jgi:hypothetical protein
MITEHKHMVGCVAGQARRTCPNDAPAGAQIRGSMEGAQDRSSRCPSARTGFEANCRAPLASVLPVEGVQESERCRCIS